MQHIVKLHGFPKSIVSDRDRIFISKFWQQLFRLQGTRLAMSFAYHPQTDGQSEVFNKTLEMYLRCLCYENPKNWLSMLPWAEFWYNTSHHSSIRMSPFKALYGREPPAMVRYELSLQDEPSLQEMLLNRDKLLDQLKSNMAKSQQFMKIYADKNRRQLEFEKGDLVLVKLQPYRQHSVALKRNQKLGLRYFGPFIIIKKLSSVAYKLQLPEEARIHNVFHVSVLKPFRGDQQCYYLPLPLQTTAEGAPFPPTSILGTRTVLHQGKEIQQYGPEIAANTTWEIADDFNRAFHYSTLGTRLRLKEWVM